MPRGTYTPMLKIGSVSLKSPLVLAPMAGISDLPMRRLCRSFGASLCYSEMVSAKALHYKDKKTKTLLKSTEDDAPLSVQIFGHEPEIMAEGARLALEISNADIVDINMGCPVNKDHPGSRNARDSQHGRPRGSSWYRRPTRNARCRTCPRPL